MFLVSARMFHEKNASQVHVKASAQRGQGRGGGVRSGKRAWRGEQRTSEAPAAPVTRSSPARPDDVRRVTMDAFRAAV